MRGSGIIWPLGCITPCAMRSVIGVAALVFGFARRWTPARIFGLALLGVVTLKVFIVDLAALDVAYRVLSFVALGILLLGAAYLYSRFQPASVSDA